MTSYQFINVYTDPATTLNGAVASGDVAIVVAALPADFDPAGGFFFIWVTDNRDPEAATRSEIMRVVGWGGTGNLTWSVNRVAGRNNPGSAVAFNDGDQVYVVQLAEQFTAGLPPASHVLATNTGLGSAHTISGATAGWVLRATSALTAQFMRLVHGDLGSVGPDDHHPQAHDHSNQSDGQGLNPSTLAMLAITPAQITADQNDYTATDSTIITLTHQNATILRLSTDASHNLTGLVAPTTGINKLVIIENVGSNDLVLKDQSASSAAANRFMLGGVDQTVKANQAVSLVYDQTSSRWRAYGGNSLLFGSPVASAVGDTSADGTASTVAHSDHKHAREAFGSPVTSAVDDSASDGVATTVAHSDHKHAREAFAAPAALGVGGAQVVGTATSVPHSDHQHAMPGPFVGSGSSHAPGFVPDPGATAGTTKFLREDGSWQEPAGATRWEVVMSGGSPVLNAAGDDWLYAPAS